MRPITNCTRTRAVHSLGLGHWHRHRPRPGRAWGYLFSVNKVAPRNGMSDWGPSRWWHATHNYELTDFRALACTVYILQLDVAYIVDVWLCCGFFLWHAVNAWYTTTVKITFPEEILNLYCFFNTFCFLLFALCYFRYCSVRRFVADWKRFRRAAFARRASFYLVSFLPYAWVALNAKKKSLNFPGRCKV